MSDLVRTNNGQVEFYNGSTLATLITDTDCLISVEITKSCNNTRFFGMVYASRISIKIIYDPYGTQISSGMLARFYINGTYSQYFTITEVNKDEVNKQVSITGWDYIDKTKNLYTADMPEIETEYFVPKTYLQNVSNVLGTNSLIIENFTDYDITESTTLFPSFNVDSTTTVFEILEDIAEACLGIIYIDNANNLVLKRADTNIVARQITEDEYFELDVKEGKRLVALCSATELGDNYISKKGTETGTTQYFRENCLLDISEKVADVLDADVEFICPLTYKQYELTWIGDPQVALGDRLSIESDDGYVDNCYVLDITTTYDGSLRQKFVYEYGDDEDEDANPTTLGDSLKQTYAKVDKVNKEVSIVVSDQGTMSSDMASILLDQGNIKLSVKSVQEQLDNLTLQVSNIEKEVDLKVDSEEVNILVQKVDEGPSSITTSTGFTFNSEGLTISKSASDISTVIDEDGMSITKAGQTMLDVNNQGVDAINLTAHQYFIIGNYSRFQDYKFRTGCFWIGG